VWNTEGVEDGAGFMMDTVGTGNVMRYNLAYNNEVANIRATLDKFSTYIYGNVSYGATQTGNYGIGIQVEYYSNGVHVYNNTVYGNTKGISVNGMSAVANSINNTVVTNNISTGNTINLQCFLGGENDGTMGSGNVYTYNDFGAASTNFINWGFGVGKSTYSAWETATGNCGTTGCSHSVQADPLFVNAAGAQFWLQSGSPAIDAGTNLGSPYNIGLLPGSSWPNSVLTGDQNSYGNGWEVGAYIFTGQTVQ
jgi:hypothetical protein